MKIQIDLDVLSTEALCRLAYALTNTEGCRHRGQKQTQLRQLRACVSELEQRGFKSSIEGSVSELREMADGISAHIERERIKVS